MSAGLRAIGLNPTLNPALNLAGLEMVRQYHTYLWEDPIISRAFKLEPLKKSLYENFTIMLVALKIFTLFNFLSSDLLLF